MQHAVHDTLPYQAAAVDGGKGALLMTVKHLESENKRLLAYSDAKDEMIADGIRREKHANANLAKMVEKYTNEVTTGTMVLSMLKNANADGNDLEKKYSTLLDAHCDVLMEIEGEAIDETLANHFKERKSATKTAFSRTIRMVEEIRQLKLQCGRA